MTTFSDNLTWESSPSTEDGFNIFVIICPVSKKNQNTRLLTLPTMLLHSWTNQILIAGQLAVLHTHPQTWQHIGRLRFGFSLHSPQTEVLEKQAAVVGSGPSTAAGLLFQQELSQGLHTAAKWVTGVQKDDWQHRSNKEWLLTQSPLRPQITISLQLQEKVSFLFFFIFFIYFLVFCINCPCDLIFTKVKNNNKHNILRL